MTSPIGKITLFMGPMFSGKTTLLIETIQKTSYKIKQPILVYYQNKQDTNSLKTNFNYTSSAIQCTQLKDILTILDQYDIIGIDEGHLFPDLVEISEYLCKKGKSVYIAALSGDYKMEPFENIANLISKADKIKLLKAYCYYCKKEAGFTLRTFTNNENENLLNKYNNTTNNIYRPVCKMCYFVNN
jgi:thymidine kinase